MEDLPGGPVVKNLPANAVDLGSTLQALEQLSPCATTTKHSF